MLFAAYCGVTNAVRYQVSIDNACRVKLLTCCIHRHSFPMPSHAQTSLPSSSTGFPFPSPATGMAAQAVSRSPSTTWPTLLMPTPPPMTSSILPDLNIDLGLLLPSLSSPIQPPAGHAPVFVPVSHLGPFTSSPGAPIVGIGAELMRKAYLTPPLATFQEARPLTNGCVSHQLYLRAQGVAGTSVLLPTGLCLVLPSMPGFPAPSLGTGQASLMSPSTSIDLASLTQTWGSLPAWSINSSTEAGTSNGPSLVSGLTSMVGNLNPVSSIGSGIHPDICQISPPQPGLPPLPPHSVVLETDATMESLPPLIPQPLEDPFLPLEKEVNPGGSLPPCSATPPPISQVTGLQMLIEASEQRMALGLRGSQRPRKFQVDKFLEDLSDSELAELATDCLDRPRGKALEMELPWDQVRFAVYVLAERVKRFSSARMETRRLWTLARVCAERRLEMEERAESARLMNDFSSTDESDWPPTPTPASRKRKVVRRENAVLDIMGNPVPL